MTRPNANHSHRRVLPRVLLGAALAGGCATAPRVSNTNASGNTTTVGDTNVITTVNIGGNTVINNIGAPKIEQCRKDLDRRGFAYTQEAFLGAVKRGQTEYVRLFLDCGMLPDAKDVTTGESALAAAIAARSEPSARLLVERGASPSLPSGKAQRAPLLDAAATGQAEILALLLDAKADPGATEPGSGAGALVEAARGGHAAIVKRLVAAAPGLVGAQGDRACLAALEGGHLAAAQALAAAARCAADGPTEEAPDRVPVGARVELLAEDGPRPLAANETLHGGDRIVLRVEVGEPAYVYVVLDGESPQVLFPPAGDQRFEPGGARRVPQGRGFLQLSDGAGTEDVVVYASRAPLPRPDVARPTRGVRSGAAAPSPREASVLHLSLRHEK